MGKGPRYKLPHKRRREKKTNYKRRLALLKSDSPRLVIRKHNNSIVVQIVEYKENKDKTLETVNSKQLRKFGWKGHLANTSSAYLSGYLLGLKLKKEINKAVLDIGLQDITKGNVIFAALKGVMDGGIEVPCSKEVMPSEKRLEGEHIAEYSKKIGDNKVQKEFSKYLEKNLDPKDLPKHFSEIKNKIGEKYG